MPRIHPSLLPRLALKLLLATALTACGGGGGGTTAAAAAPASPASAASAANPAVARAYQQLVTAFQPQAHEVRDAGSGLLHPGLSLTKAQLDTMQRHVRRGDEPWAAAFEAFAANARSARAPRLYYEPAWTEILAGPANTAGNYITVRMAMDADVAFHQVVMWFVTGDELYRRNAEAAIRNYFSITKVEPHWDSQIRWGIAAYKLCLVEDLLRHTDANSAASQWTADDHGRFAHLMTMGQGLVTGTGYWMNQHQFATMGLIGTAVALDDKAAYQQAVERTTVNTGGQAGGRNGSIKWQMRWVTQDAATGAAVDVPQVQVVEMARDQGHAWINPGALSLLAQVAFNQRTRVDPVSGAPSSSAAAVEVFDFLDDRLLAGADYLTRYSWGEAVRWVPVVMDESKPPQIGSAIVGPPRQLALGILYNHYRYVRQWSTQDRRFKAVAQAYETLFPEADGGTDLPGNGTLFYTPDAGLRP